MRNFLIKKIRCISEQDGDIERKFKSAVVGTLQRLQIEVRAYLVRVCYDEDVDAFNVAVCYKIGKEKMSEMLLVETANIFKKMFGSKEHIDILFLDHVQEEVLREICCPFYTSPMFQVQRPDFYLISKEGYTVRGPVACFKRKKIMGINPGGYLLCDIQPGIVGQQYGLGSKDITQVLFVCRQAGFTLFPISEWPTSVYVVRALIDKIETVNYINESDIELMWWGSLYKNKKDVFEN
jgi:hypothetical protein